MVAKLLSFNLSGIPRVIFGTDSIKSLEQNLKEYGEKVLLVCGENSFIAQPIQSGLKSFLNNKNLKIFTYSFKGEPSPEIVNNAIEIYRGKKIQVVVAVGGGSILDAGKAIAAMLKEQGRIEDYLEGIGSKAPLGQRLPLIAIPTTAGTGSEATMNAVISKPGKNGYKKSLRHPKYIPDIAIIDPLLACSCSPEITAASGMDAFSQLLESYLSDMSNPFTDSLALSGIGLIPTSLYKAFINGNDINARSGMSYAAFASGITLAHAGLGLVHGYAQPLGSIFPIPHGVVCGTLMGAVNRHTVKVLRQKDLHHPAMSKYANAGKLFTTSRTLSQDGYIDTLIDAIDELTYKLKLPLLSAYGVKNCDVDAIVEKTGLKNHPCRLEKDDLSAIILNRL